MRPTLCLLALCLLPLVAAKGPCEVYDQQDRVVLPDQDCDVVPDGYDNCPQAPNADQADADRDGQGDACSQAQRTAEMGLEAFEVEYVQSQQVEAGRGIFFPIHITSDSPPDIKVELPSALGSYRVEAPPRGDAFIFIQTRKNTPSGRYPVRAVVSAGARAQTLDMALQVVRPDGNLAVWIWALLLLVLLAVLASLLIAFDYRRRRPAPPRAPPYTYE